MAILLGLPMALVFGVATAGDDSPSEIMFEKGKAPPVVDGELTDRES